MLPHLFLEWSQPTQHWEVPGANTLSPALPSGSTLSTPADVIPAEQLLCAASWPPSHGPEHHEHSHISPCANPAAATGLPQVLAAREHWKPPQVTLKGRGPASPLELCHYFLPSAKKSIYTWAQVSLCESGSASHCFLCVSCLITSNTAHPAWTSENSCLAWKNQNPYTHNARPNKFYFNCSWHGA